MIRNYRWKPDTCGCAVNEVHDDVLNQWSAVEEYTNPRGEKFLTVRCPAHASISDADELYGVLHRNADGENKMKNLMEKKLLEDNDLGLAEDFEQEDGSITRKFKKGVRYDWSFEGTGKTRVLKVGIVGATLPKTKKDSLISHIESAFPIGRVQMKE